MNTITNLNHTSSEELRQLLEIQGIVIKKTAGTHFLIECPSCKKPEAFVYYNQGTRNIKCNRGNNCGLNVELWHYIAEKQGIDASNKFEILKYINEMLGREFKQEQAENYNIEKEERNKEQKFLADCNQIFFNTMNNDKENEQVLFSLMYLKKRGYTEEHIEQFSLGFFPDYNNLLESLITQYSYSNPDAVSLMLKYFKTILENNGKPHNSEDYRHRITFAWYNSRGDIAGFSVRRPTTQGLKGKYYYNDNMKTGEVLFNLSNLNIKDKKSLVVVEGVFDALTASYLSTEEVRQHYHFVACGKSTLSSEQALLLKNKGYSQVILFLDNDEAGKNFFSSVSKLREHNITSFVALISNEYQKVKDIDELIRTYPKANLQEILDDAKYAINVQIDLIIKNNSKNHKSLTDREKDTILTECSKLKPSLLMSEHEPYRKIIYEKLGISYDAADEVKNLEQNSNAANSDNVKSEIEKLKSEIQLKIQEAEDKEGKYSAIDIHDIRKRVHEIQLLNFRNNIAADKKDLNLLDNILTNIKKYNDLLTTDYEQDTPYTYSAFLADIKKSSHGLKTGFPALDQHVTIQPASLVFIAGRPSHGKTTMMLNLCRNMIEANPDKSFLFYSYEENKEDILLKIILGKTIPDKELNEEEGWTLLEKTKNQLRKYALVFARQKDGAIRTLSTNLDKVCKEVEQWINDGRLQILTKKPNVEILSSAIIERVLVSEKEKPVAAIFIDYVQKLNTEEERVTRQQELQRICQALLNTALDRRVNAAIILGAQVNREVKSLDTFNLDNMREAGDIEQDANLVLGVWDEQAAKLDSLQQRLASISVKIEDIETGCVPGGDLQNLQNTKKNIENRIKELYEQNNSANKNLIVKILKNRNGKKDVLVDLSSYPDRFLITGINNNHDHVDAAIESIRNKIKM